jgi:hypothetical protein
METMSRWNPQDGLPEDDEIPELTTPGTIITPIVQPGQYAPSPGDALLLNTMDQQRSSARDWLELLQQEPAAGTATMLADADGQLWDFSGSFDLDLPIRPANNSRGTS